MLAAKGGDRVSDHHASLPIAYRLYLPNKWAKHAGRRKKAHVPKDIVFKIEPQIAREQIPQACVTEVRRERAPRP